jgi:hypothetical protein
VWGFGALGLGDWPQSPIPNPQSPIPNPQNTHLKNLILFIIEILFLKFYKNSTNNFKLYIISKKIIYNKNVKLY